MKNIKLGKRTIWITNGSQFIHKIEAMVMIKNTLEEGQTSLRAFIIIDNIELNLFYDNVRYYVVKPGMTKEDWFEYGWESLVK